MTDARANPENYPLDKDARTFSGSQLEIIAKIKAFSEGEQAYYDGLNREDNPYNVTTQSELFKEWHSGLEDVCHKENNFIPLQN